ncbi:MAG: CRISPR-associated endonuclease Cas1 [Gammaproteobacteria bacterium]|nr:MAG: CRISPR-associated endonuclease Cas1 [Pseudomonadota bacterium]PIE38689.1 MAG: CRISPR-associated endonuclease Cas1 [Gammaproteobacteria bacterium]
MITVLAEPPCSLSTESKALRIEHNGRLVKRIPLSQVDCLVIRGKVQLNADVLQKAAANGVPTMVCDRRSNGAINWLTPGQVPSVQLRTRQHRIAADSVGCLPLIKALVQAKFNGYRLALATSRYIDDKSCRHAQFIRSLTQADNALETAKSANSIRGMEGAVSKSWFALLAESFDQKWGFSGRNRRPALDPVNALLSLSYSFVQGDVRQALVQRGFDIDIGFLHQLVPGRPSLVLDILEPFRPLVDCFVVNLCQTTLSPDQLRKTNEGWRLAKSGWPVFMPAITRWRQSSGIIWREYSGHLWPGYPVPEQAEHISDICHYLAHHFATSVLNHQAEPTDIVNQELNHDNDYSPDVVPTKS